jgi:hypothetical protein
MANGNRGIGLLHYAKAHYDPGHQRVFLRFAHAALSAALSPEAQYEGPGYEIAKRKFKDQKDWIESKIKVEEVSRAINLDDHDLGTSEDERNYRLWCLRNHLFLNPLNDLGPYPIAAHDILMLPTFVTAIDEPPTLIGFFNQMKQEFVSARWLYYAGVHACDPHFSDRDVRLLDTRDDPSYGLAIEKTRAVSV